MAVVINGSTGITTPGMTNSGSTSTAGLTLSSGSITFPNTDTQAVGPLGGPGSNQTWQNVTGSRATSTTYTNSTGRPITVLFTPNASANMYGYCVVGGASIGYQQFTPSGGGGCAAWTFIVPNGSTYSITPTANLTLLSWYELR